MTAAVGGSKITDNVVEKALLIHAEVRAHLEVANTKYKAGVDKYQRKKVFWQWFGDSAFAVKSFS